MRNITQTKDTRSDHAKGDGFLYNKLNKLRQANESEDGFTLIELLIVIVIIGILAAIAIPIFFNQQIEAQRASVKSDVRNTATQASAEAYELRGQDLGTAGIVGTTSDGNLISISGEWDDFVVVGRSVEDEEFTYCFTSSEGTFKEECEEVIASTPPTPVASTAPAECVAAEDSAYDQIFDYVAQGFSGGSMTADINWWENNTGFPSSCSSEAERAWIDWNTGNGRNSPLGL